MELQAGFGVDVAMALDVCPPFPAERAEVEEACRLTLAWAERCRRAYAGPGAALRDRAGRHARGPAPAVGRGPRGRSTFRATRSAASPWASRRTRSGRSRRSAAPLLPEDRPRYLMGVGTPADLLASVRAGSISSTASCRRATAAWATPTRGAARSRSSTSASRKTSRRSIPECGCPVCRRHSRAYLRNLFVLKDFSAPMLLSMHNVYFYLAWMREIREAIGQGRLSALAAPPEEKLPDGA